MVFQVNVPVGKAKEGETAPRRNYKVVDGAVTKPQNSKATTIYDFFQECVKTHGDRNAMGWRDLKQIYSETKKVNKMVDGEMTQVDKSWMFYEFGKYNYLSFPQLSDLIESYGRGICELGVAPEGKERLHIFASTSPRWMQTFLASQTQAIPVVTAYDTLGEQGLTHSLVQTGSVCVFTDNDLLGRLVNPLKEAKSIRYIIHSHKLDSNDKRFDGRLYSEAVKAIEKIKEVNPDVKIISFEEIVEMGNKSSIPAHPPKPEDTSCIMYTSGSTGTPKGVVLTHANILAGIGGVSVVVPRSVVDTNDRVIAFLPLAHIFELVFELICFWWGGCLGYATVKSLSDGSVRNCRSDMAEFQPTVMVGVASVWETVRKGILAEVNKQPYLLQKLFWGAYRTKLGMKSFHVPGTSLIDNLIFKRVKAKTGGHLRYLLNGGSAISTETQKFITNLLAPMLVGYGLTETVANTTVVDPNHFEMEVAGMLTGAVTVKLIDVADAGYYAKNNQGEVLIKGASVLKEYFKNDEETKNAFEYEQGWFSTGDIGTWTSSGQLKIIDRKKNLVKTMNGEYIALEKLESTYRSDTNVANICCYADENKVKPIGIVIPNEQAIRKMAVELGIEKSQDNVDMAQIVLNDKICDHVTKSLINTGKSQGLKGIELLLGVVLVDEEWTPQNGFVTSAQKLQRKKILASVKERVDELYKKNS